MATRWRWTGYGHHAADVYGGKQRFGHVYPQRSVWAQQQKLTASDAAASDLFGNSVAVDGVRPSSARIWTTTAAVTAVRPTSLPAAGAFGPSSRN
ncbi:MAG: FG-GAP repeat protein [Ardenticatenaceae bacterium]|nr:FG-GAP repeat protein [Ardenticatenaceae bacterium]